MRSFYTCRRLYLCALPLGNLPTSFSCSYYVHLFTWPPAVASQPSYTIYLFIYFTTGSVDFFFCVLILALICFLFFIVVFSFCFWSSLFSSRVLDFPSILCLSSFYLWFRFFCLLLLGFVFLLLFSFFFLSVLLLLSALFHLIILHLHPLNSITSHIHKPQPSAFLPPSLPPPLPPRFLSSSRSLHLFATPLLNPPDYYSLLPPQSLQPPTA